MWYFTICKAWYTQNNTSAFESRHIISATDGWDMEVLEVPEMTHDS